MLHSLLKRISCKYENTGTRKMAQGLSVCTVLAEKQSSGPNTNLGNASICNDRSRGPANHFQTLQAPELTHVHSQTQMQTCITKNKIDYKKEKTNYFALTCICFTYLFKSSIIMAHCNVFSHSKLLQTTQQKEFQDLFPRLI